MLKIVNALNINTAHGQDNISIRMIKFVVKSLFIIIKNFIDTGTFPNQISGREWYHKL